MKKKNREDEELNNHDFLNIDEPDQDSISLTRQNQEDTENSQSHALIIHDQLQHYLAEIRRYPFLSKNEEKELAFKYHKHKDLDAVTKLILSNLRFVPNIAMEYKSTAIPMLDLIQEGNIGLMEAIKRFDPSKDVRLITYASWWIRANILKYILKNWRLVKIGTTQNEKKLFFNLMKEKNRLEAQGITENQKLLEDHFHVSGKEIIDMQHRLEYKETSLDTPPSGGEDENIAYIIPSPDIDIAESLQQKELSNLFREKLAEFEKGLKDRDRYIFNHRLLSSIPKTLQDLSDEMHVSKERIRQLEEKILKNFKKYMKTNIKEFDVLFKDFYKLKDIE